MHKLVKVGYIVGLVSLQLSIAGCLGSGSGGSSGVLGFLGSLFGGGDSSSVISSISNLPDSEGPDGGEHLTPQQIIQAAEQPQHAQVAVLVNPEPASLALFGGGLGAAALWRRRRAKRKS